MENNLEKEEIKKRKEKQKNVRKALTLTGLLMAGVDPSVEDRDINTMCCPLRSALMVGASKGRFKFCVYRAAPHSKISFRRSS